MEQEALNASSKVLIFDAHSSGHELVLFSKHFTLTYTAICALCDNICVR